MSMNLFLAKMRDNSVLYLIAKDIGASTMELVGRGIAGACVAVYLQVECEHLLLQDGYVLTEGVTPPRESGSAHAN